MSSDVLVFSTSLNPESKSRILAQEAVKLLDPGLKVELIDLVDYKLPFCDGDTVYSDSAVTGLTKKIQDCRAVLLAVPVYNFAAGASAKNLIELTGQAWEDKIVGFLCAAGGKHSYMSIMGLANSLMLDFRCVIIPRFVYADSDNFGPRGLESDDVRKRIKQLVDSVAKFAKLNDQVRTAS
jgi:NAD(P)H-dependent FMN reductase